MVRRHEWSVVTTGLLSPFQVRADGAVHAPRGAGVVTMSRRSNRRLKSVAWGCGAAIGVTLFGLGVVLAATGLPTAVQWGSLVSALAGLLGLSVAAAGLWGNTRQRRQQTASGASEHSPEILERLASAIEVQWRAETEVRQLNRLLPLSVRWRSAAADLMDRLDTIAGVAVDPRDEELMRQFYLSGELTEVGDAFERLPSHRLVILGEPGAGKSAIALRLTRELLLRRHSGEPVPVLLTLGSWNPATEHFYAWVARCLEETYPVLRVATESGESVAQHFVNTRRVLPILDGLDEMSDDVRVQSIGALNRALTDGDPLVLTSRTREYYTTVRSPDPSRPTSLPHVHTSEVLAAAAVIELLPLLPAEVENYLGQATPVSHVDKWTPVFAQLHREPTGPLGSALSTPLMTSLARVAYCNTTASPAELLDRRLSDRRTIEAHLLDRLIPSVYEDRPPPSGRSSWNVAQANAWLRFLAVHLDRLGTRELAWWDLRRLTPRLSGGIGIGLLTGLSASLLITPIYVLAWGLRLGIVGGLTFMLISSVVYGLIVRFSAVSTPLRVNVRQYVDLRRRFTGLKVGLRAGSRAALVSGPSVGIAVGLVNGFIYGLVAGPTAGAGIGLATGVAVGLADAFSVGLAVALVYVLDVPADVSRAVSPSFLHNVDRVAALIRAVVVAVAIGLATALVAGLLVVEFASGFPAGPRQASLVIGGYAGGLVFGLGAGLAAGLATAYGRLTLARVWLAARHRLPWALMAFLDDAHHRGVLRQVAGTYEFRHSQLQNRLIASVA